MCTGMEIFMIASTAVSAVSQIQQGEQKRDYANYQAAQANADADAEREAAQVRAEQIRKAGRRTQSEARASLAASGIEVSGGSAVTIDDKIAYNTEEDALNEILTGTRRGARLDQEAVGARAAGDNARTAGYMGAFGSVLSSGASYYGSGWKGARTVRAQQAPAPVEDRTIR